MEKVMENENLVTNIYRIEAHDSIICGYFCIAFIDFMPKGKSLLNYTKSNSPNKYEKMIK